MWSREELSVTSEYGQTVTTAYFPSACRAEHVGVYTTVVSMYKSIYTLLWGRGMEHRRRRFKGARGREGEGRGGGGVGGGCGGKRGAHRVKGWTSIGKQPLNSGTAKVQVVAGACIPIPTRGDILEVPLQLKQHEELVHPRGLRGGSPEGKCVHVVPEGNSSILRRVPRHCSDQL